ncbi:Gfo/Idh/MocA family protein [Saccharopolyspora spinosa]|nr:Gfo/Idh/MocA family oxidoreductase [Saccharopolyspora spinosa]PKW18365.1 NDP-hexose-3-ketoreductase [Saccharopolyspora spinosa]
MTSSMRKPVRIGVLGCASFAWRRMLPAMCDVAETEVVAVASRDPAKAERFAARFECEAVLGYQRLLERPDIDAVYVPLPPGMHAEWIGKALEADKHVLAEKPLTTTASDTARLVGLARRKNLLLRENYLFLHHGRHDVVRDLLQSGEIGELREFTAVFGIPPLPDTDIRYRTELGGGALLDIGVYPARAARHFLLGPLTVLGASSHEAQESGVDLSGSVLLQSEGGTVAHLGYGFVHHYRSAYELWGSRGRIVVDRAFTPPAEWQAVIRIERKGVVDELSLPAEDQVRKAVTAFARDIRAGTGVDDPAVAGDSGESMIQQAALVEAIGQARRCGST